MKHLMIPVGIILLFILNSYSSRAQYNQIDWSAYLTDKNVKMSDSELVEHLIITTEGNQEYVYITGQTLSNTSGQLFCNDSLGNGDGFLAKFNKKGKMIWIRYLGSNGKSNDTLVDDRYDWAYCLASDKAPNGSIRIYVGGASLHNSDSISCSQSSCSEETYQPVAHDSWEGFIAKYDGNGNLMRWTYLGGGEVNKCDTDEVLSLDIHDHKIYAAGYTESHQRSLLDTSKIESSYDTTYNGGGDGFIAVLDTCLSGMKFFTYYSTVIDSIDSLNSPTGQDRLHCIRVGSNGAIYTTGSTSSSNGISFNSNSTYYDETDALIGKWKEQEDGSYLPQWSKYMGGVHLERGRQLALDNEGNIFFDGTTRSDSTTFHPVGNVIQKKAGGDTDGFVAKLDSNGNTLWLTYLGSTYQDVVNGIQYVKGTAGNANCVALTGLTLNCDFFSSKNYVSPILNIINGEPIKPCPQSDTSKLKRDAFVIFLTDPDSVSGDSMHLKFGSFLGGSKNETFGPNVAFTGYGPMLAVTSTGTMYISFSSASKDIGNSSHGASVALKGKFHGQTDAVLMKLTKASSINREEGEGDEDIFEESGRTSLIRSYPNPSHDWVTMEIKNAVGEQAVLKFFDVHGNCLMKQVVNLETSSTTEFDLRGLPCGIYFAQLISERSNAVLKIVKQ